MAEKRDGTYIIPAGLALVLVLMAAAFFGAARYYGGKFSERSAWPSTEGVVVRNSLSSYTRYNPKRGVTETVTNRDFKYTYAVAGRSFTGSEYGVHDEGFVDMTARYPVGTKVTVFYDPADPAHGVLTVGYSISPTPFYAMGGGMLVLCLPFAYLSYRLASSRKRAAAGPSETP